MLKKFLAVLGLVVSLALGAVKPAHAQYNWILGGSGSASCIVNIPNDTVTGTVQNQFARVTTAGQVVNAATTDTTRIAGLVLANAGKTGSASVQVCGIAAVNFDGGVTAANFVIASTTAGGKAHDSGSNSPSTSVQTLGEIISQTNAATGQYLVLLDNFYALGGGGGGGTVTSIGMTVPSILSVTPASITTSGTFAISLANENANTFLGGPVSGSATTPTFRLIVPQDVPGNVIAIPNSATGTTLNKGVKFTTASPVTAIITATTDTTGIKGVCIQGCGTTGTALIQQSGQVSGVFDGVTTANDFVQNSPTVNGDFHDAGATYPTSGGEVLGIVETTNGSAGTYTFDLFSPDTVTTTGAKIFCTSLPTFTGDVTNTNCAMTVGGVQGNSLAPNRVTTSSSSLSVNLSTSLNQFITLHDTLSTLTFTAPPADGNVVRFKLTQSNAGSHTVTWPAAVKWPGGTAPTLTTTNGQADFVQCLYDGTTTNYDCSSVLNFAP